MTPDEHDRFIQQDIADSEPKTTTAERVIAVVEVGLVVGVFIALAFALAK